MEKYLPLGKLPYDLLGRMLGIYARVTDPRVVIGPKPGEDAAVIDFPDRYLVAKTDPITFAADEIGWYAVQVNANDIATKGAEPKWFQASILLPENKTTAVLVETIFRQIHDACGELGIEVVGGHTEISHSLDRPIVVGNMLGEVAKDKLVSTSGAKPGDDVILTKGIVIEGTSIIAREKDAELKKRGYDGDFIERCRNVLRNPGLSVMKDALLANRYEVHAMHDPTEGGLAAGLYELALASETGLYIEKERIPVSEESQTLCREFGLEPLGTITSGTLIIAAPKESSGKIISLLGDNGIAACVIGEVKERGFGVMITSEGKSHTLAFSPRDEITKLFE